MSSLRITRLFESMPNQVKLLGGYSFDWQTALVWAGRPSSGPEAGRDACVFDIDGATWADNNRRVILVALPAMDQVPGSTDGMKTASHSVGQYFDGGVRFKMYAETPEDHTGNQAKFMRHVMHHLLGQQGGPVELFLCANDTEPTIAGVNGAGSTASFTSAGLYVPYGIGYVGGV